VIISIDGHAISDGSHWLFRRGVLFKLYICVDTLYNVNVQLEIIIICVAWCVLLYCCSVCDHQCCLYVVCVVCVHVYTVCVYVVCVVCVCSVWCGVCVVCVCSVWCGVYVVYGVVCM